MPEAVAAAPAPVTNGAAPPAEAAEAPALTTLQEANQTFAEKMKAAKAAKKAGRSALDKVAGEARAETAEVEAPKTKADIEQITADELFAAEALGTPEGIARARDVLTYAKEHLEQRHRTFDRADIKLKAREKAVSGTEERGKHLASMARRLQQEFHTITGRREAADGNGVLVALDKLGGGNGSLEGGRALFEMLAMAYAREGKLPEKTKGERELETRLERMEREYREREQAAKDQQVEGTIAQTRQQIAQMEMFAGKQANDSAKYPTISGWLAEERCDEAAVGKLVGDLMQSEGLDLATAIGTLESRLAPKGQRAPQGESASDEAETSRVAAPARKNGARQSTVLPSDADQSLGTSRKENDDERRERLARNPAFMKRLGVPLSS
jgi:hypothetical protein